MLVDCEELKAIDSNYAALSMRALEVVPTIARATDERVKTLSQEIDVLLPQLVALQGELSRCHDQVCALTWKPTKR